jgi:hypothetical protein
MIHTNALKSAIVLIVAGALAAAALIAFNLSTSNAQAPANPVSSLQQLQQYRDQLISQPLRPDPGLIQNMLSNKLTGILGGDLSDYQRNILSDGTITLAEYRQAESDWRACMNSYCLNMPPMQLDIFAQYNVEYSTPGNMQDVMLAAKAKCDLEYTSAVSMAWSSATAPLQAKIGQTERAAAGECLSAEGYSPKDVDPSGPNTPVNQAYAMCTQSVLNSLGTSTFLAAGGGGN